MVYHNTTMNPILILHLFLIPFLFSCQTKKDDTPLPENPLDYFDQVETLTLQKVDLDTILPQIMEIAITKEYLVVLSTGVPYLYVYGKNNGKLLTTYSAKGKGPHEFMRPQVIESLDDDHIQLYDLDNGKLFDVNIDRMVDRNLETLETVIMEFKRKNPFNIKRLAQERQIATGFYPRIYNILETGEEITSSFGDYIIGANVDSLAACFSYQGHIGVHEDGEQFAYGISRMGLLQIGRVNPATGKGEIIENLDFQVAPVIDDSDDEGSISSHVPSEIPYGFQGLAVNESFIFTLYSGKSSELHKEDYRDSPHLLVLDWKGKPVKRFEISPEAKKLSIDRHRNMLYLIAINEDTLEDELYKIKVDDLNL